jgi:hypothetical protein
MEFENWQQILLIVVGLLILWGIIGLVFKMARKVISCGCSIIVALAVLYFVVRWAGGQ